MDSEQCQVMMRMPQVEIPDEKDGRFCVLSYEQVKRLNDLMCEDISIHGRDNFPTIDVKLCELVKVVRRKLEDDGVHVREIRLNGSGASSVLVRPTHRPTFRRPTCRRPGLPDGLFSNKKSKLGYIGGPYVECKML
jgi:hypothetical protein